MLDNHQFCPLHQHLVILTLKHCLCLLNGSIQSLFNPTRVFSSNFIGKQAWPLLFSNSKSRSSGVDNLTKEIQDSLGLVSGAFTNPTKNISPPNSKFDPKICTDLKKYKPGYHMEIINDTDDFPFLPHTLPLISNF